MIKLILSFLFMVTGYQAVAQSISGVAGNSQSTDLKTLEESSAILACGPLLFGLDEQKQETLSVMLYNGQIPSVDGVNVIPEALLNADVKYDESSDSYDIKVTADGEVLELVLSYDKAMTDQNVSYATSQGASADSLVGFKVYKADLTYNGEVSEEQLQYCAYYPN